MELYLLRIGGGRGGVSSRREACRARGVRRSGRGGRGEPDGGFVAVHDAAALEQF